VIALLLIISLLPSLMIFSSAADNAPTRVIHVVYDDSGSMFADDDRWCQAKYAMEVFAAMLGPTDSMKIYVMSDYEGGKGAPPRLSLSGADDAQANVDEVHNMPVGGWNTRFYSVETARDDFAGVTADEKWLVVLTDGDFQQVVGGDKDKFFQNKADDIKVMFLLIMGKPEWGITEVEEQNIFFDKVGSIDDKDSSKEIPSKITEICSRIFNRQKLDTLSFDIPMSELVVFVQGANVTVNGIRDGDKPIIKSDSEVSVQYSDMRPAPRADADYSNAPVATNLAGKVATFKGDFNAGDYTLDISDYDEIEIYYKPNIDVRAYLSDASGNEVTNMEKLESGEYVLDFGFVKKGTDEKVPQSDLLNPVTYYATITNNGVSEDYAPGDRIKIEEGELTVDAGARYMDYNTVVTQRGYRVFRNKKLSFDIQTNPEYTIVEDGFTNANSPIIVKTTIENEVGAFVDFTDDEWTDMENLTVEFIDSDAKLGVFTVKKSDEIGIYELYPSVYNNDPVSNGVGDFDVIVKHTQIMGDSTWSGDGTKFTMHIEDGFSWWGRNGADVINILCWSLLLLIIIWIATRKVYPKKIVVDRVRFDDGIDVHEITTVNECFSFDVKKGIMYKAMRLFIGDRPTTITINQPISFNKPREVCDVTVFVSPVTRRFPPSARMLKIDKPISAADNVEQVKIQSAIFKKHNDENCLVPQNDVKKPIESLKVSRETNFKSVEVKNGHAILKIDTKNKK